MKALLLALALSLPVAAYAAPQTTKNAETPVSQGVWIDVRSAEEFRQGHLAQAVNIPLEQIGSQISRVARDKNTPVHLYCRSGRRAEAALQVLKEMGYTKVTNHGGYEDVKNQFAK